MKQEIKIDDLRIVEIKDFTNSSTFTDAELLRSLVIDIYGNIARVPFSDSGSQTLQQVVDNGNTLDADSEIVFPTMTISDGIIEASLGNNNANFSASGLAAYDGNNQQVSIKPNFIMVGHNNPGTGFFSFSAAPNTNRVIKYTNPSDPVAPIGQVNLVLVSSVNGIKASAVTGDINLDTIITLQKSIDGGKTWTNGVASLSIDSVSTNSFIFDSPNIKLAVTEFSGIMQTGNALKQTKVLIQPPSTNGLLEFMYPDKSIGSYIVATTVDTVKGSLIASLTSSGNVDQVLTTTAATLAFDTNDNVPYGTISRTGNTFTVSAGGNGLYIFNVQPQVTENAVMNATTIWCQKNGVNVTNSGIVNSSTGINDTRVIPLVITLDLVAGDQITFLGITSIVNGATLDFTVASAPKPSVPSVIIDIKGWKK